MAGGTILQERNYMVDHHVAVDLGDASGTGVLRIYVPATGAEIVEAMMIGNTVGAVTTSGVHTITIRSSAGVALTDSVAYDAETADGTVGAIFTGNGVSAGNKGTELQFIQTETGTITDGAIVDVHVIWAL